MQFKPSRRWESFVYAMLFLGVSGFFLVWIVRGTVDHVTAHAQPATIVDTGHVRRSSRHSSVATSLTFKLRDGSIHAEQVHPGFFWWPSVGETIHVHEVGSDDWKVSEDFSWPAAVGGILVGLIPWLIAVLKLWEWVKKTVFPQRWAESQRRERERRHAAYASKPRLSRRQRAKAQRSSRESDRSSRDHRPHLGRPRKGRPTSGGQR